jgi:Protein of unknown function (DUF4232)
MNSPVTPTRRIGLLVGAAGLAGLVAACAGNPTSAPPSGNQSTTAPASGNSTAPSSPSPTASSSPTSSSPAQTTVANCLSSDLQAKLGQSQGAAGTFYQVVVLTNTSNAACTLYGYPGVSFVTGVGGHVVGAPARRNTALGDELVTLQPGAQASSLVGVEDVGAIPPSKCHVGKADWLQVYPPGDTGALYVQYSAQVCTNASQVFISDGAVRAGTSGGA